MSKTLSRADTGDSTIIVEDGAVDTDLDFDLGVSLADVDHEDNLDLLFGLDVDESLEGSLPSRLSMKLKRARQ